MPTVLSRRIGEQLRHPEAVRPGGRRSTCRPTCRARPSRQADGAAAQQQPLRTARWWRRRRWRPTPRRCAAARRAAPRAACSRDWASGSSSNTRSAPLTQPRGRWRCAAAGRPTKRAADGRDRGSSRSRPGGPRPTRRSTSLVRSALHAKRRGDVLEDGEGGIVDEPAGRPSPPNACGRRRPVTVLAVHDDAGPWSADRGRPVGRINEVLPASVGPKSTLQRSRFERERGRL